MGFEGSLDDLGVVDVLQLLHVSRKTGDLRIRGAAGEALISIKDGAIVGSLHPVPGMNVGRVLLDMRAIAQEDIDAALEAQRNAGPGRRPLIQTLVDLGRIEEAVGWKALETLIEATVVEVVSWKHGTFGFDIVEVAPSDSFRHLPDGVSAGIGLDTQAALMEAMRILDERSRNDAEREAVAAAPPATPDAPASPPSDGPLGLPIFAEPAPGADATPTVGPPRAATGLAPRTEEDLAFLIGERLEGAAGAPDRRRVVTFGADGFLKLSLRAACAEEQVEQIATDVEQDVLKRLVAWRSAACSPVLIVDFAGASVDPRWQRRCATLMAGIRRDHPEVPVVALTGSDLESLAVGYRLGATAVLPRPIDTGDRERYVAEMKGLFKALTVVLGGTFARRSWLQQKIGEYDRRMATLRERIQEIRDPHGPADVSLVVLRYVADFVDRCVLFLVRKRDMLGLGAFGVDGSDATLSRAITRIKIPFCEGSLLGDTVKQGRFYHGPGTDPLLQTQVYDAIGAPASPDIVLLPLKTRERTAALIYGDFGARAAEAVQTDALEILAEHAGMAFELALWERRSG